MGCTRGNCIPQFNNFGPGVVAAFAGCAAEFDEQHPTVWYHPRGEPRELADLTLALDREDAWFRRVDALTACATARWGDAGPICSFTDLGGNLDILSSFRPGDLLLYDLYDHPAEVERGLWEAHAVWWEAYEHLHRYHARQRGTTSWSGIFSRRRTYMLQCDFCYMISPAMFDRFVRPELVATCQRLDHAFYHLDGPGQLPHLDSLLAIDALHGIQWIPGAGQPPQEDWVEVYRKIRAAGKLAQPLGADLTELRGLAHCLGSAAGFHLQVVVDPGPRLDEAIAICEELGVPL